MSTSLIVQLAFFISAMLFIVGLKKMANAKSAQSGIVLSGIGMLLAVLSTFLIASNNLILMFSALFSSALLAWWSSKRVEMVAMPQMVALYNGMGGGAAGAIAIVELLHHLSGSNYLAPLYSSIAITGALIGSVSFSGSLIAFLKLQGWLTGSLRFPMQHIFNGILIVLCILFAVLTITNTQYNPYYTLTIFIALSLLLGLLIALPIGGADMPVIISLFNGFTGLAVALEGFVLGNPAMIIAGTVVGSAGTLLTLLMAKAMNRSIANVLFSNFGSDDNTNKQAGTQEEPKTTTLEDLAIILSYSQKVIIIPGYGMAVAQAQHKISELTTMLVSNNIKVLFAIHPVAGRMPGHMNVLLAEAGINYDYILDLEEANQEIKDADIAIVIGANDTVNPSAKEDKSSPIYGMPIINAGQAKQVVIIKRGKGAGFSGVQNSLFTKPNCSMLYGDAQKTINSLNSTIKSL